MATEKKNTWTKKNYTQEQLDGLSRRLNEMMEQGQEDKKTKKSYARSNLQEVTKRQNEMIAEAEARRKQRIKERRGMMPANKRKHTLASRKEDKEVLKEFYEVFNRKRDLEKPIKRRGEGISNALRGSRKKERTMGRMTEQARKGIDEALERDRNTTTIGNVRKSFDSVPPTRKMPIKERVEELKKRDAQKQTDERLRKGAKSVPLNRDRGYETNKMTAAEWREQKNKQSKQLGKDSDLSSFRFDKKFRFIGQF